MKQLWPLLGTMFLFMGCVSNSYSFKNPKDVSSSVVRVQTSYGSWASGSVVSEDEENLYILTVSHVIPPLDSNVTFSLILSDYNYDVSRKVVPANLIVDNDLYDLALFSVSKKEMPPLIPLTVAKNVTHLEKVTILGYPEFRVLQAIDGRLFCSIYMSAPPWETTKWRISAPIGFGFSGGPILNESGEIVGILQGRRQKFASDSLGQPHIWFHIGLVCTRDDIVMFLKKNLPER
jgi:S1-C subfamily serine protease